MNNKPSFISLKMVAFNWQALTLLKIATYLLWLVVRPEKEETFLPYVFTITSLLTKTHPDMSLVINTFLLSHRKKYSSPDRSFSPS